MPRDDWDLAESARHEAGHAIGRIVLDTGPIHRIVVLRELDAQGCGGFIEAKPGVFVKDRPDPEPRPPPEKCLEYGRDPEYRRAISRHLRQIGIETYSGVAAQDYITAGDWYSHELLMSSRTDRRLLAAHCAMFGWTLDEHRMDGALLRASRRFVDAFFGPLLAIEEAMLHRLAKTDGDGELFGDELLTIFKNAPTKRNSWREREWTKAAWAAVREEMRLENERRERNAERSVHLDPERAAGRPSSPAPLAPFSPAVGDPASGKTTCGGVGPARASGRSPSAPLAGLPLAAGWASDARRSRIDTREVTAALEAARREAEDD